MRFILMHKTDRRWEAGEIPSRELIARVGGLLGELAESDALESGEGLRASSEGVRITFADGERTLQPGPFTGGNELPTGFTLLRTTSLDEAVEWASREAEALGGVEVDVRPVNEPWDIGMRPKPENLDTRRFMALRKSTTATESGSAPTTAQRSALSRVIEEATRAGVHLATETLRPSGRGRRYLNSRNGVSIFDGPFIESKELLAGYVIVRAGSLDEAGRWAERYLAVVESPEVEVRELE